MATIKKKAYAGKIQTEQEIITLASKASDVIAGNRKAISIAAAAVAAVLLVLGGVWLKRSADEQQAGPLFAAAYSVYSAPAAPQYARAIEMFRDVQKKYPSTKSGSMAQYYLANALMDMGRYEEALKEYQSFTHEYTRDSLLLGLVYERMGYLYQALGKQQDAISAFGQAESLNGTGIATLELARLYEAAGNEPESQKRYKQLAEKMAGTPLGMDAAAKTQKITQPAVDLGGTGGNPSAAKGK